MSHAPQDSTPLSEPSKIDNDQSDDNVPFIPENNAKADRKDGQERTRETTPPPVARRPSLNATPSSMHGSFRLSSRNSRPQLQSQATTALSLTGVQVASKTTSIASPSRSVSRVVSRAPSLTHLRDRLDLHDDNDSGSLRSYDIGRDAQLDNESLLGTITQDDASDLSWTKQVSDEDVDASIETLAGESDSFALQFQYELEEIDGSDADQADEDALLVAWKAKFKHFFVLSASGKPIYSRHGDDHLISNYIGIAQTIISFYQGEGDSLKGFTAGDARLVFLSKGPLNLVAVSKLGESDAQLRVQLESLYMQILSTLTLPSMEKMFSNRPSTDLRRPLQGTDVLLDGLADGFTRGSPSTLLSALECLRLRKTQRKQINDTFLKLRSPNLLYGLVVAAGRLVSVVRPKKHSLHPGDLHLIFNMLFEAGGVRAGGGENWIPLCLPGFNNTGFLYMYVSFFSTRETDDVEVPNEQPNDELAILLISANKESFFELRKMRDELVSQLETNGSMAAIKTAIRKGRSTCAEIVPGDVLRHFLYKSRANVQFAMPSFEPHFKSLVARRKLLLLYGQLHENLHNRTSHLKVQHVVSQFASALAWETPMFELYCVADAHASRTAVAQSANRVVQWIRREEERVFIIGGAVF